MKKNFSILLVLLLTASMLLSACGGAAPAEEAVEEPAAAEEVAEEQAPAEAEEPAEGQEAAQIGVDPMEGAIQLTDSTTEASAMEMAELMQITESISWEGWQLPAETTWDDVFAYYDQKAADAGWSSDAGAVKDVGDNKVAVFGKADGSKLTIIYLPQTDMVQVLAITGK